MNIERPWFYLMTTINRMESIEHKGLSLLHIPFTKESLRQKFQISLKLSIQDTSEMRDQRFNANYCSLD